MTIQIYFQIFYLNISRMKNLQRFILRIVQKYKLIINRCYINYYSELKIIYDCKINCNVIFTEP